MIRVKLRHLLDDKSFRERRHITLSEVARSTGVSRATLTRVANSPGYNVSTDVIDSLCRYLECEPGELLEFIDSEYSQESLL